MDSKDDGAHPAPSDAPATFPEELRTRGPGSLYRPIDSKLLSDARKNADPVAIWILARQVLADITFCVPDAEMRHVQAAAEHALIRILREPHEDTHWSVAASLLAIVFETMADDEIHPEIAAMMLNVPKEPIQEPVAAVVKGRIQPGEFKEPLIVDPLPTPMGPLTPPEPMSRLEPEPDPSPESLESFLPPIDDGSFDWSFH